MAVNKIILVVFGISGVGKSTSISHFIQKKTNWTHIQAGSLIKSFKGDVPYDELRITSKEKILDNQKKMVHAFWRNIENVQTPGIIFDGHSVIYNDSEIIKIPFEIIAELKPNKIIFMSGSAEQILERRSKDFRKRPLLDLQEISCQQKVSKGQAIDIASKLSIPYAEVCNEDELFQEISRIETSDMI